MGFLGVTGLSNAGKNGRYDHVLNHSSDNFVVAAAWRHHSDVPVGFFE
jgi:hypothetical protein